MKKMYVLMLAACIMLVGGCVSKAQLQRAEAERMQARADEQASKRYSNYIKHLADTKQYKKLRVEWRRYCDARGYNTLNCVEMDVLMSIAEGHPRKALNSASAFCSQFSGPLSSETFASRLWCADQKVKFCRMGFKQNC